MPTLKQADDSYQFFDQLPSGRGTIQAKKVGQLALILSSCVAHIQHVTDVITRGRDGDSQGG